MKDPFKKLASESIIPVPAGSEPVFIREESVPIPVRRLERFIEAEVRLDILKKHLEDTELSFMDKAEARRILGMEVFKDGNK